MKGKKPNKSKSNKSVAVIKPKPSRVMQARPLVNATALPKPFMNVIPVKGGSLEQLRVRGLEVIAQIPGSSSFTSQYSAFVNPLTPSMFPKAASVAGLFEKWKIGPGGIKFSYIGMCPSTRSGTVAGYVETDPADVTSPSGPIDILNQQYSSACPAYENASFILKSSLDSEKWFATQLAVSPAEALRTSCAGRVYWYTTQYTSADASAFSGYLTVEYDITFAVFRPPTSSGFEIENNTSTALIADGTVLTPYLSNEDSTSGILGWGARAGRFLFDNLSPLISSGSSVGFADKRYLMPPVGTEMNGSTSVSFGPVTVDLSLAPVPLTRQVAETYIPHETKTTRSLSNKVVPVTDEVTTVESFCPWQAVQNPDGEWFYRDYYDGPLLPYSEKKLIATPMASNDCTLSVCVVDESGTTTVLYSTTVNSGLANLISLAWSITPSNPTRMFLRLASIFSGSRLVTNVYNLIGAQGN